MLNLIVIFITFGSGMSHTDFYNKQDIPDGLSQKTHSVSVTSDLELWRAFKSGSESAFIRIYESHYSKLVTYGINFTQDRELVKDCIQDMFMELREKRNKLSDTDNIKPWLFKIFRRKIHRYLKRNALTPITNPSQYVPFDMVISHEEYLINRQINEEQLTRLNKAIEKLTVKEREAIYHFYFELHTYREIAEIMGYNQVKTARTLVYRALSSLRNILEPESSLYLLFFL